MTHVMLDLETYGVRPGCPILSIGACVFDEKRVTTQKFYRIAKVEQHAIGLIPEASTVEWWETQSDDACAIFKAEGAMDIVDLLKLFAGWLPVDARVWGNGADFDPPILAEAYKRAGLDVPWKPYNGRCYRTLKNLVPHVTMSRSGVHHNALDDAVNQANHAITIAATLGLVLG